LKQLNQNTALSTISTNIRLTGKWDNIQSIIYQLQFNYINLFAAVIECTLLHPGCSLVPKWRRPCPILLVFLCDFSET